MIAAVPPIVVDVGVLLGAWIAFVGAALTPPARWLFRRLVAAPVTEWHRQQTHEVTDEVVTRALEPVWDELRTNGGSSLRDVVNRIEQRCTDATPPT